MSQKVVQECDYQTKNGLDCHKGDGVVRYRTAVGILNHDGVGILETYLTYECDLCPRHSKMLHTAIQKVMGPTEETKDQTAALANVGEKP